MEKKKIKVYLQYPWRTSDSQYYRSMMENPPKNTTYVNLKKNVGMIGKTSSFLVSNFLKKQVRYWASKSNIIIPNAHLSPKKNYNLIHCAHCLSKNKNYPWVADVESLWQMWVSGRNKKRARKKVLKYLKRKNCKKLMAWTEFTKNEIIKKFPEIKEKVEVVYYAMPEQKQIKKNSKEILLFFSGRHFFAKGGLHATEAIDRLTQKHKNVRGIVNGAIPKEIIQKYSKNKKIKFYQLMPYKEILKIYQKTDIFVYPGYSDSFGFVFMDAMAFGAPIVTINNGGCRKEIVEDGKNGFIIEIDPALRNNLNKINEKVISKICEKTSLLIKNKKLREKMSREGLKIIKEGKFSIKERNKRLERIYSEAMK